nr:hypothetical protein [Leeia aquatica]
MLRVQAADHSSNQSIHARQEPIRVVCRAKLDDRQLAGGDDHHKLPHEPHAKEGIRWGMGKSPRHAPRRVALSLLQPEACRIAGREGLACAVGHPTFGQDALTVDHAIIQIKLTKARPVTCAGMEAVGTEWCTGEVKLHQGLLHPDGVKQLLFGKLPHGGWRATCLVTDKPGQQGKVTIRIGPGAARGLKQGEARSIGGGITLKIGQATVCIVAAKVLRHIQPTVLS